MNGEHLTEIEIQNCALGTTGLAQIEHASSCPLCNSQVTNYRLIFAMMDELPQPVLNFDAAEVVIPRLPQLAIASPAWSGRRVYAVACFLLALLFVPVYLSRNDLVKMTRGLGSNALYLIGLTTLIILIFQVVEMYRKHVRKVNTLISGDLQL
ncbi:MAG: hypothetical protein ACHQHN_19470 [Sphingobacteriales bacterium]